jgi:hypothetical protein
MFVVAVIVENINENDGARTDTLTVDNPMKNLLILIHQGPQIPRMDVYVDCNFQGSIPFKTVFRDLPDVNSVEVVSV